MSVLIVVNTPQRWPLQMPGVKLVAARAYLSDPSYSDLRGVSVFNLCRTYSYQSLGYYVSLLAEARGHKPQPSIKTIQDMKLQAVLRIVSSDLEDLIQKSLAPIRSDSFDLSIYFGRPTAQRYRRLALQLFHQFPAPLLRARFVKKKEEGWQLQSIRLVPANDVPLSHRDFVADAAGEFFASKRSAGRRQRNFHYHVAILHNPSEDEPPSDSRALRRFVRAAEELGMGAELITKDDYSHIAEFDALFIRETTAVNHYTYRFASRAEADGLVVIDSPQSIVRCANKVYLAEALDRRNIPIPKTLIVHKDNRNQVADRLGFPCVLKQPDSSFSRGVSKISDAETLERELDRLLEESELIIAQQFIPTAYDWRVGIFDRRPLFACRYHMAHSHWQVIRKTSSGKTFYGAVQAIALEDTPPIVVRTALRAANFIGDGLYGVDLKQSGRRCYVIEVNDNPNIEAGYEDRLLKQELYLKIMTGFYDRIVAKKADKRNAKG